MKPSGWQIGGLLATVLVALAAAGCDTGSDVLATGNAPVRIELVLVGDTVEDWDCVIFEFDDIRYRPLDGTCGNDSANPGDPCLNETDCDPGTGPGTCENSYAGELIANLGVAASDGGDTVPGNLLEGTCNIVNPTLTAPPIEFPASIVLSEGLYEISEFNIANVGFYRVNGDVKRLCLNQTLDVVTWREAFGGGPWQFSIPPDEDMVLRLGLHVDVMEQEMTDGATGQQCAQIIFNIVDILSCDTCNTVP
jgi:hypothetical protein